MVKQDLVNALVGAFPGITKHDMLTVVNTLFDSMAGALATDAVIDLRGIGRFKTKKRGPAKGRNPKTGAAVFLPERLVIHYKPADSLTKLINRAS